MNRLPSGTVTFLFTDIEGSTKLAQQHRQTWKGLCARHHMILRNAIEGQHGYVFQIVGDAFCAAFHTAGDALRAAVQSQIDLNAKNWGDAVVKVRMGIHIGSAELQPNGEYHGFLAMSHVQRLMSVGHGGQMLISQTAQELAGDDLPAGVSLLDLGPTPTEGLGITLSLLACHLRAPGELQPAASTAQESIALLHEVGDKVSEAGALDAWGRIALAQEDNPAALRHLLDGLALQQKMKDLRHAPSLLEGVAQQVIASGRPHVAIRLLAVVATLRDHIGLARLQVDRAGYERVLASLVDPLDEASFQALWAEGCSLTTAEAIGLAAEIHPRHTNVLPNQGL